MRVRIVKTFQHSTIPYAVQVRECSEGTPYQICIVQQDGQLWLLPTFEVMLHEQKEVGVLLALLVQATALARCLTRGESPDECAAGFSELFSDVFSRT